MSDNIKTIIALATVVTQLVKYLALRVDQKIVADDYKNTQAPDLGYRRPLPGPTNATRSHISATGAKRAIKTHKRAA